MKVFLQESQKGEVAHRLSELKESSHPRERGALSLLLLLCLHPPVRHCSAALPAIKVCESRQAVVLGPQG